MERKRKGVWVFIFVKIGWKPHAPDLNTAGIFLKSKFFNCDK